ncbi:conserved hypothetical protein [Anaeromyxobacter sp. K]|uniref:hypothetical protein n=1 Tax=Anaeromyxobacter sp. (strain K) TaxID=447217 RepID=UPI00015F9FE5|nr:hypothetical protein [Anaeromyxobacter sp. K]ACG73747.1 conserved hypothetical protein [Anaeromyxobacter sp. K]
MRDRGAEGMEGEEIGLAYGSATAARRDAVPQLEHGLLVRTRAPVTPGDWLRVRLVLAQERVELHLAGEVRWATPLASGAIAAVELRPASHRDRVQLDLLFQRRTAGAAPEPPAPGDARAAGPLTAALFAPDPLLRAGLAAALEALGRAGGRAVEVAAPPDPAALLRALAATPHGLAVLDCDAVGAAAAPLLAALRGHPGCARLPVILIAASGTSDAEDAHAVVLARPVDLRRFGELAAALLGAGGPCQRADAPDAPAA